MTVTTPQPDLVGERAECGTVADQIARVGTARSREGEVIR